MVLTPVLMVCALFPCVFYYFIGCVSGLRSGVFAPTLVELKCDVFAFVMFVSIVVEYKGGRLIEMIWRSSSLFPSKFKNQLYSYSCGLTFPHSFRPLSLRQKNYPVSCNSIHPSAF